jgi:tetratricopeptide (TPR) repeat protein
LDGGGFLCYDTPAFKGKLEASPLMNYSGNSSLSSDVKQRILSTFEQTLALARDGNRQEALLGCDFVLRMDPRFEPARVLQERLRTSTGPVPVQDLLAATTAVPAIPDLPDPFAHLDSLSLDLPDLPFSLPGIDAALRGELQSLLDQRRFQELMTRAQKEQAAIAADPELQRIANTAQERMEAEPYVLKFLGAARQALQAGQTDEVGRLLEKVRALDPSHPGIAELEQARGASPVAHWTATGPVAPAPPPAPPAPPGIVIPPPLQTSAMPTSLAFGGGDSESDRRIHELLDEGQTAFNAGDPQGAIDAWSRIFLIDIDHQEASRRIEAARKLKAESERQVEEIFHDGVGHLEGGDLAAARQAFERVLEIQPGYFAAREYLQQLDAGNVPRPRPAGTRETTRETFAEPAPPPAATPLPAAGRDLKEEILVPPEPPGEVKAERRPARKTTPSRRDPKRARRLFLVVGGIVLVIALAIAAFLFEKRDQFFPNSQPEVTVTPPAAAAGADPIARAQRLNKLGKTAIALNQLRRITPNDPHYAEAQKLIAQWGGAESAGTTPEPGATPAEAAAATPGLPGVPGAATPGAPGSVVGVESQEKRTELLAGARQAFAERSYLKALNRLEAAGALGKLDGDDARLLADTKQKLATLDKDIDLFHQHEWEFVARDMWTKHEADPANRDVTQLLADSYYNLAVRDLQRNDAPKAAEKLKQVLELQDDPLVRRHLVFAQSYQDRNKDLLYRIYVKYLPYR